MGNSRWKDYELVFIKENYKDMTYQVIGEKLGRTKSAVDHKVFRMGLEKGNEGKWEDHELEFIEKNYKDMTYQVIAAKLGRSKCAVDLKVNKLGLEKGKYSYNKDYFKIIDTAEKAYWLGFIYADGSVSYDQVSRSAELHIKLQARDGNHLEKFNKALNGNVEVKYFRRVCNLNDKEYEGCDIRFYSNELVLDLIEFGVVPNKSLVTKFPRIREDLISHFIRGYFDGDGCICLDKQRKLPRADFTGGSLEFLISLREELSKNNIRSYKCMEKNGVYRLYVRGMKNFEKFFNYIYANYTVCLDRKLAVKNSIYEECDVDRRLRYKISKCNREVICLTTKEIFPSIREASRKFNINDDVSITNCCKKKVMSAGEFPETGEPLIWMYYEEYLIQKDVMVSRSNYKLNATIKVSQN